MNKTLFQIIILLLIFTSCVSNKRITYLQHETEPKKDEVQNQDNVVREYTTHIAAYKLRANDIIALKLASITPSEYNFIQHYEEQLGTIKELSQYNKGNAAMRGRNMQSAAGGMGSNTRGQEIDSGFKINKSGILELPYVGEIQLEGLTIADAEELVKEKLQGYLETPVVRIQLLNFHFTIMGEVNNEGRYTIYKANAHIFDALSIAGNLAEMADRSKIKIVRFSGEKAEVLYLNTLEEDMLGEENFYLQPDDLIIVPPLSARETQKYTLPAYSRILGVITSTASIILLAISLSR